MKSDGATSRHRLASVLLPGALLLLAACKPTEVLHDLVSYVTTPCPLGTEYVVSSDSGTPGLKKFTEKWCQTTDDHGEVIRHGPYVEVYESGSRKEAGQYSNGRRTGSWTRWYPGGKVDSVVGYKDGKPQSFLAWHDNGQRWEEGYFEQGSKQGVWIRWHANGQKEFEGSYEHGALDRGYTLWHDNGQKEEQGEYKQGVRSGLWTKWHRNGQKRSEILFHEGKPHEWYKAWHENGRQSEQALFHEGKPEGTYTIWHDNGEKEEEGTYRDGTLEGQVTAWDRNGNVWLKTKYQGGSIVEEPAGDSGSQSGELGQSNGPPAKP